MSRKRQDDFSISAEPALGGGAPPDSDPSEQEVARREAERAARPPAEIDTLRDSVWSEPGCGDANPAFGQWLSAKKAKVGLGALLLVTLLAGVAGGPFSVFGALIKSSSGGWIAAAGLVYAVIFAPLIEEMLKQAGTLFLLERRPWWLKHGWQFPLIAIISASIFATIENLLYIHVHFPSMGMTAEQLHAASAFRWRVCTLLHLSASLIASVGMWKIWRHQIENACPAKLSAGYPGMLAAVILHGGYNLFASLFVRFGEAG